jgi:hypothetical protein
VHHHVRKLGWSSGVVESGGTTPNFFLGHLSAICVKRCDICRHEGALMGVPQDRSRPGPPAEGPSPSEIEMLENGHFPDNAADSQSGHGMGVHGLEAKKEGRVGMKMNTKGYQKVLDAGDECGVLKEGLEEAEEFGLPEAASGRRQLKAMLWRQYLFKASQIEPQQRHWGLQGRWLSIRNWGRLIHLSSQDKTLPIPQKLV